MHNLSKSKVDRDIFFTRNHTSGAHVAGDPENGLFMGSCPEVELCSLENRRVYFTRKYEGDGNTWTATVTVSGLLVVFVS